MNQNSSPRKYYTIPLFPLLGGVGNVRPVLGLVIRREDEGEAVKHVAGLGVLVVAGVSPPHTGVNIL